ncbi:MAG: terminase small subunit [Gammaproteobacteria bacterium]|nr:terminase small subunit [Rhodocyclaceae bacterium]MBU3908880.1 terminase small subunit [Gammaproteobacteria bacterium]MBU3987747.1 terminase small subunit [Gammaproteobacteria bacterium]MBU4003358.1 terminase small subunit [Gammaproteobacteria bacterium]MBU4021829.1 terminase small subunit [Gammaproteobacteria bacterium]
MRIIGQEQIAAVFGVAPKTVVEWQEQGFPVAARGGPGVPSEYDSETCINWLVEREVRKVQNERPQDRLARVQADKIEMENAERRGQLIQADQLEPKLRAAHIFARENFLDARYRLARELPSDVPGREDMLQAELEAFLHRLADWAHADDVDEEDGA